VVAFAATFAEAIVTLLGVRFAWRQMRRLLGRRARAASSAAA
jgi:hypothetical protein